MKTFILVLALAGAALARFHPKIAGGDLEWHSRIVGGEDALPNELPYQVSVQKNDWHFCGGAIVGSHWVLTAGHCCGGYLDDETQIRVVAGDLKVNGDAPTRQVKRINGHILHEHFDKTWLYNDICMLKMTEAFEFNDAVQAIKMPEPMHQTPEGTRTLVSGWGHTAESGPLPDTLQKVEVPAITDEKCNKQYGNVMDSMLCCGLDEGGKDACQGDSGGPLIDVATRQLLGLVSWGAGCARPGKSGVYTEVSYFVDWVNYWMKAYRE